MPVGDGNLERQTDSFRWRRFMAVDAAIAVREDRQGVDIIDIGGERHGTKARGFVGRRDKRVVPVRGDPNTRYSYH